MTKTMIEKSLAAFAVAVVAFATLFCGAAEAQDHQHDGAATSIAPAAMSTGEVVKIDRETGKITLRHGPLENLGMPGMTMAFKAAPALLEGVKPGDKVRFVAEKVGGTLTVTALHTDN